MARPQPHPVLSQLKSARTTLEQTAALRALKNEIVGHVQRKETWIAYGVLEPIVRTIAVSRSPATLNGKDAIVQVGTRPLTDEEATKLQALQLVASFAHGSAPSQYT
jgi:armadillo repeat-containing protein 8